MEKYIFGKMYFWRSFFGKLYFWKIELFKDKMRLSSRNEGQNAELIEKLAGDQLAPLIELYAKVKGIWPN